MKSIRLGLAHLQVKDFLSLSFGRLLSANHYYQLRMKIGPAPEASRRSAPALKAMQKPDWCDVEATIPSLDQASRRDLLARLHFSQKGIDTCYAHRSRRGELAYFQWLIYPTQNDVIREHFSNIFQPLGEREVMLENVFVFPRYRGLGLLQRVTDELLRRAAADGYRQAVMYIRKDNIASLNAYIKYGFGIFRLVREYKLFGYTKRLM